MAQVAQIKRDSAQAEAQVSHHESRVKEVKNIVDRDREQLRCLAVALATVPDLNPLARVKLDPEYGLPYPTLRSALLSSDAAW
jgi:hypothetical protein